MVKLTAIEIKKKGISSSRTVSVIMLKKMTAIEIIVKFLKKKHHENTPL